MWVKFEWMRPRIRAARHGAGGIHLIFTFEWGHAYYVQLQGIGQLIHDMFIYIQWLYEFSSFCVSRSGRTKPCDSQPMICDWICAWESWKNTIVFAFNGTKVNPSNKDGWFNKKCKRSFSHMCALMQCSFMQGGFRIASRGEPWLLWVCLQPIHPIKSFTFWDCFLLMCALLYIQCVLDCWPASVLYIQNNIIMQLLMQEHIYYNYHMLLCGGFLPDD